APRSAPVPSPTRSLPTRDPRARLARRLARPLGDAARHPLLPPHFARRELAVRVEARELRARARAARRAVVRLAGAQHEVPAVVRSEEHTSELQSPAHL